MSDKKEQKIKPKVQLVGVDGNIFVVLGVCSQALKREGLRKEAEELAEKVFASGSYEEALGHCLSYVDSY